MIKGQFKSHDRSGRLTVLSGELRLVNGGTIPAGTEKWKVEETSTSILWHSIIEKNTPFPHNEEIHVTATPRRWSVREIRISSVGHDVEERFEGRVVNSTFVAIILRGEKTERQSIPVLDTMEFDYLSPIFNTITFHRLRLRRGGSRDIETVYIFPASKETSFEMRIVKQHYLRMKDEPVTVPAGRFPFAKHYVYTNLSSGWTGNIWTDNLETVLQYEKLCELLSYNRNE